MQRWRPSGREIRPEADRDEKDKRTGVWGPWLENTLAQRGEERRGEGKREKKGIRDFFIVAFSLGCWFDFNSYRSLWLFSSLFKPHFRAKQNLIKRKGEAISIGITPLEKRGGILLETEKCVCLCNPLAPPSTHTHTRSLQITNTHHRWPARLVFSPPPPSRIMASGGPSSSSSTPFLFCQHVCPSNGSVCVWDNGRQTKSPPTPHQDAE